VIERLQVWNIQPAVQRRYAGQMQILAGGKVAKVGVKMEDVKAVRSPDNLVQGNNVIRKWIDALRVQAQRCRTRRYQSRRG
jgi:hypothetical protein